MEDREKQIEEMAKIIGHCYCDKECQNKCAYCDISSLNEAKKIYEHGFRKLPENSVVLTMEARKIIDHNIKHLERVCNKHEKEIDSLEKRNEELEEALLDMVVQFCSSSYYDDDSELRHTFMSAEERAFDVLDIEYGEKVSEVYKRFEKKWRQK